MDQKEEDNTKSDEIRESSESEDINEDKDNKKNIKENEVSADNKKVAVSEEEKLETSKLLPEDHVGTSVSSENVNESLCESILCVPSI